MNQQPKLQVSLDTDFHRHYRCLCCSFSAAKHFSPTALVAPVQRLLSTLAVDQLRFSARWFQPPVFQYVCPVDVWSSHREDVGQPKICRILFHLCSGRRSDSTAGSVHQWRCLPDHWCIRCSFRTPAGLRCHVAEQQIIPYFFPGTHQGKMVCTDLWCRRIEFSALPAQCHKWRTMPTLAVCFSVPDYYGDGAGARV